MESLKVWLNQQIAKILGDLQEREPLQDPSPTRALCRIFFVVGLLLGFSLLLLYNFIDAPDARVVQIHRLTPGDKNDAFPSCFLQDRNSPSCMKWSKAKFPLKIPVSCPCTNTSARWKDFVKFYILHENSMDWNMSFTVESSPGAYPKITVPDDTIPLRSANIVIDKEFLTAERFCRLSYLWPIVNTTSGEYEAVKVTDHRILHTNCVWMATLLFPGSTKSYEDRTRSTKFLNTPSLLNWQGLNTLMAQLARDSVLTRRLELDMALSCSLDTSTANFRRSYNALARLLAGLLDRNQTNLRESYIYAATQLSTTLSSNQFYDNKAMVWYLADHRGPIFLQPHIYWETYRQTCFPEYCEVNMPMRGAQKFYWALGILGGVATIALAVVTTLLWPCTAMLLLWISERNATEEGGPGTPQVALVAGPQPVEPSSPLDCKTLDSKPLLVELSSPPHSKTLDSKPLLVELSSPPHSKTLDSKPLLVELSKPFAFQNPRL